MVRKTAPRKRSTSLHETRSGQLGAPLRNPAAAAVGARVILAGGLTAQDTSSSQIIAVTRSQARVIGSLPIRQHDASAAAIAGSVYLFGGGDGSAQLNHILRVNPQTGTVTTNGRGRAWALSEP